MRRHNVSDVRLREKTHVLVDDIGPFLLDVVENG
jgi:hypothetical protein